MTEALLLSVDKARRLADPPIGRDAMYDLVRTGRIRSVSVGRKRLIPIAEMTRWIERELLRGGVESVGNGAGMESAPRPVAESRG